MAKAIGMRLHTAPVSPTDSRFFGDPTIPEAWSNDFDEDVMFFCQIRLADLAELDTEGVFPHTGYLYIFLDTRNGDYELEPIVRYYAGEPDTIIDGFNEAVEEYEQYNHAIGITFCESEIDADGCRLLGIPSDWNYAEEPPHLLMQIDHLDETLSFLSHLDGFTYLFFGEDLEQFTDVQIMQEFS